MEQISEEKILKIPVTIFETAETKEELEDWLLTNDPVFIEEIRKIKKQAAAGMGRPLEEVVQKWNIKL